MSADGEIPAERRREVEAWIAADPDPDTRLELEGLLAVGDRDGIEARFAAPLTFGTAGLRGALGAGPARMNRLVVRRTTAGLAAWLLHGGPGQAAGGIVVGRDARHGSEAFAHEVVEVASSYGITVHCFDRPTPTPLVAFAVRRLGASAGVMITASHNPASDNGYKVYLADGAQVCAPYDTEIAVLARSEATSTVETKAGQDLMFEDRITLRGTYGSVQTINWDHFCTSYTDMVLDLLQEGGARDLSIVYTPMHGMGGLLLPSLVAQAGFPPVLMVSEQAAPDPNFPTVPFPNPEEPGALDLALATAKASDAELVLANDPDADRLAVAVLDRTHDYRVLTGDEIGVLLADHLLRHSNGSDRLVATSIVSSSLLRALAGAHGVTYIETLTGFKWLARAAAHVPESRLLFAYEEAIGFAVTDNVADKDGISAALVFAELVASAKAEGRSVLDRLDELGSQFGIHLTGQWSLRFDGEQAQPMMAQVVARLRAHPPKMLAGMTVTSSEDLLRRPDGLPHTDAIIIRASDADRLHIRMVVRPSGTEPKLKVYLEVVSPPPGKEGLAEAQRKANVAMSVLRDEVATLFAHPFAN